MKIKLHTLCFVLVTLFMPLLSQAQNTNTSRRLFDFQSTDKLPFFQIRQAGLKRDATQTETLIRHARENKYESNVLVVLRALSRMGDERALPYFDEIVPLVRMPATGKFIRIMKARLYVESRARGRKSSSLTEARTRLNLFLSTLDFSLDEFKKKYDDDVEGEYREDKVSPMRMLREIADIIYSYQDRFLLEAVKEGELDLKTDTQVSLKIRLAFFSPQERVTSLLTELEEHITGDLNLNFLSVLSSDLGTPAQRAIEAKLDQMARQRNDFSDEVIANYLRAYACFPNNRRLALIEPFVNEANNTVRPIAEMVKRLKTEETLYIPASWIY